MGAVRAITRWRLHVGAVVLAVVISGMAYTLWWGPVVRHVPDWTIPGDIWGTFRDAHIIGWGGEGILYASNILPLTGYISMPGMPVLLAPVALISGALHLSESLPLYLARPTAWLVLGPIELSLGASVLFPLDSLAQRLHVPRRRRTAAVWLEAALIWPVVAVWGHPEDLVALGLAIYAAMEALDGRWRRSAVLLSVALAFQPLVVVLVPLLAALAPWRRLPAFAGCVVAPSTLLLVAPLAHAWPTTVRALVDQPTYPAVNHPTPWIALSRVLEGSGHASSAELRHSAISLTAVAHAGPVVAGGPVRLIPFGLSLVIAAFMVRGRPSERTIWWLAALLLSLRCVFEAVMTPYYAVPALAVVLVVAARSSRVRFGLACLAATACTCTCYRYAGAWSYYVPVVLTLSAAVALAVPGRKPATVGVRPENESPASLAAHELEPALTAGPGGW